MTPLERDLIQGSTLPTIPRVAQKLLERLENEGTNLSEVASLVSADPALAARVIRLINSPFYGLSREITNIQDAALYLGFNSVRSVALSFSLLSVFRDGSACDETLDAVWCTSLMKALAARRLAAETGQWDPEEAFLGGLLSDCGVLLLYPRAPGYPRILEQFRAGRGDLFELEQEHLGTDHARIGGLLLESWSFPERLREVIQLHHDADTARSSGESAFRVRVLHAAWLCARTFTVPAFTGEIGGLEQRIFELLGIPPVVASSIAEELPEELRRTAGCFEIPAGQMKSYAELLAEANQKLSRIAIEADRSARELAEALAAGRRAFGDLPDPPTGPRHLDPETGLLAQPAFREILQAYHLRAREIRCPIGLLILKMENFKTMADEMGREAAIQGMREIGERVAGLTRQSDPRARLEEDQIALLAPGCSSQNLLRAAERVRAGVEDRALDTSAGPLMCQVAIGIAVSNPSRDAVDPQTLMGFASSAAERALQQAERIFLAG